MKYVLTLAALLIITSDCSGQAYNFEGSFSPDVSPFFRVPIDSNLTLTTWFSWKPYDAKGTAVITPVFKFDTSNLSINSTQTIFGYDYGGTDSIIIFLNTNTSKCYPAGSADISAYYANPNTLVTFSGAWFYSLQGVIYDPKVVGKVTGQNFPCDFGSIGIDSFAKTLITLYDDSIGQYHQIRTLSVDSPFSLDDTIEMLYPCQEYGLSPNCYFHPTHAGHYVDTAKLLEELTNDTISVVLIGDAYDAGVSELATPQLRLFPNPCDRELRIDLPSGMTTEIEIYNLFGERICADTIRGKDETIDCSQLPAGTYFALIRSGSCAWNRKLIVMH